MKKSKSNKTLEKEVISHIQPAIDSIMQKFMGVRIHEIGSDITSKLHSPLIGLDITEFLRLPLRDARMLFRKRYLGQLLRQKHGNISEVAKIADVERRSIHRIVAEAGIDVTQIREEMLNPTYVKELAVEKTVGDVVKNYADVLNPKKLEELYANLGKISKDIVKELPAYPQPLKDAEEEFERQYFQALKMTNKTIAQIARKAGLRYETVHRKMKHLGLI